MRDEKEMVWIFAGIALLAVGAIIAYGSYAGVDPGYNLGTVLGIIMAIVGGAIFAIAFFKLWKIDK